LGAWGERVGDARRVCDREEKIGNERAIDIVEQLSIRLSNGRRPIEDTGAAKRRLEVGGGRGGGGGEGGGVPK